MGFAAFLAAAVMLHPAEGALPAASAELADTATPTLTPAATLTLAATATAAATLTPGPATAAPAAADSATPAPTTAPTETPTPTMQPAAAAMGGDSSAFDVPLDAQTIGCWRGSAASGDVSGESVPGRLLVKFAAGASSLAGASLLSSVGAQTVGEIEALGVRVVDVAGKDVALAAQLLQASPLVEYAEPDYVVSADAITPNDPSYSGQWGPAAMQAPAAWSISTGSSSVVIAIIDTGVDLPNLEFAGKIVAGCDFVNRDDSAQDDEGHGTHVAGIAAAIGNNSSHMAGISWGARVMPLKVLSASGRGSTSAISAAIIYAADHGAKVINLSLGGPGYSSTLERAVNYAVARGVVVVASAGNNGNSTPNYPAAYANAIAVAATNSSNLRASFSNYGSYVDLAAPGYDIASLRVGTGTVRYNGTSMASPHVAGAAAIVAGVLGSGASVASIRSVLESTAQDLGTGGRDNYYGNGLVNLYAALVSIVPPTATPTATATATAMATATPAPKNWTVNVPWGRSGGALPWDSWAGGCATTSPQTCFSPAALTINVGDSVTWVYDPLGWSQINWEIAGIPGSCPYRSGFCIGQIGGQPGIPLPSVTHTFTSAGTFPYNSRNMISGALDPALVPAGVIYVVASGAPTSTPTPTPSLTPTNTGGAASRWLYAGNEGSSSISSIDSTGSGGVVYTSGTNRGGSFSMTGLALTADGSKLFFARPTQPGNSGTVVGDGRIWVLDTLSGTASLFASTRPDGSALNAFGLSFGSDGALYALLHGPVAVVRYGSDGQGAFVYQSSASYQAMGFAVDSQLRIFIANYDAGQILQVTGINSTSIYADESDGFSLVRNGGGVVGLAFDRQDRLYITDRRSGIWRFSAPHSGSVIAARSQALFSPIAVAVDTSGMIYVANACENIQSTIVRLDANGILLQPAPFADSGDGLQCTRSLAFRAAASMVNGTPAPVNTQTPTPTATAVPQCWEGSAVSSAPSAGAVPNQVLVKFSEGTSDSVIAAYVRSVQGRVSAEMAELGVVVLDVPRGKVAGVVADLQRLAIVEYAEPNFSASAFDTTPNDTRWAEQYGPARMQAPAAWDLSTGANSITIAVVDTGVQSTHPEFAGRLVAGCDFVNRDTLPEDDQGHGTHVAGIAAAAGNNGSGIAGISWGARIMALKALDANGSGTYQQIAQAIVYAADNGAKVVNLSLGGSEPSAVLEDAVNYAVAQGAVVVAAAGNSGTNSPNYPAAYAAAIAVAATDSSNVRASFSNYGSYVDLSAPGVSILSTFLSSAYSSKSGTSMAAPHVAGAAALLMGYSNAFTTPAQVRAALETSALDLGTSGRDNYYGYGLVQLRSAMQFNAASALPTVTAAATVAAPGYVLARSDTCPARATYAWVDATGGTRVVLADDGAQTVALPFTFRYGGVDYTQAVVGSNGLLSFGIAGADSYSNAAIPVDYEPNNFIAALWDDLDPATAGTVHWLTSGTAPNRKFVVQWTAVPHWGVVGGQTFEVILEETTNAVVLQYGAQAGTYAGGNSATIGLEYGDGSAGTQFAFNTANAVSNGLALRYTVGDGSATPVPAATCAPAATPTAAARVQTFADVPLTHPYYPYIEALYQAGYTAGCSTNPLMYCPDKNMTRAEAAVFVMRGFRGGAYQAPVPQASSFGDVDTTSWSSKWAAALYGDGLTAGCSAPTAQNPNLPRQYCPWQGHSRVEGAVFYMRVLRGASYTPPAATGLFSDLDKSWWGTKWAEAAYTAGIAPPCASAPMQFCANAPLNRDVAAYMLVRAKNLTLP